MKTRLLSLPLLLVLVVSLAACGGGSQQVPADAVAMVDGTPITAVQFNEFFAYAQAVAKAHGQPLQPTTSAYTTARSQVLAALVQWAEVKQEAQKQHVSETQAEVDKFLANFAKTQYGGSMKKLVAAYKKQGISEPLLQKLAYFDRLENKLKAKVTATAKVTEAQEKAYYNSPSYALTRSVEHILVKSKSLADSLEQQLKNGASFAKLAKKYSKDPGSAAQGGKYTATKGREVPAYDDVAFSLKTGQLSAPVDATSAANGSYGWFIIKALGPVPTFSSVQATIKATLLGQQQETLWQQWLTDMTNQYKSKVSYQSGYAPPATTTISTTPTTG